MHARASRARAAWAASLQAHPHRMHACSTHAQVSRPHSAPRTAINVNATLLASAHRNTCLFWKFVASFAKTIHPNFSTYRASIVAPAGLCKRDAASRT
jgi:hypothetical protein